MAPGQPALHGAVSPMRNIAPAQPATQAADASGDQQASAAPGSATHSQLHEAADSEYGSPLGDFSSPGAAYDRLEPGLHAPDMHARLAAVAGCSSQPAVTADGAIAATPPAPPPSSLRDGSINQAAAILAPRLHTHGPSQARGGSTSQTAASTGQPSAGPQEAPDPTRLRAVGGATGHAAAGDSAQQAAILAAPTPPPSSLRDGSSSRAAASTAQPPLVNRAPTPDPLQVRDSAGSQTAVAPAQPSVDPSRAPIPAPSRDGDGANLLLSPAPSQGRAGGTSQAAAATPSRNTQRDLDLALRDLSLLPSNLGFLPRRRHAPAGRA